MGQDQQDSEPDTDISSVFTGRLRLLGANEASSRTRDDGISRAERLVIRAAVCCCASITYSLHYNTR